ncbi:MAG: type I methionyl aminopeptidase [Caldilineaceae bacterium]|nr:type I methionyl aminopeptidase [Caldilineaceae bacterium]
MTIQSDEDIRGLQRIGWIVAHTLQTMQAAVRPGMTTAALDEIGRAELARYQARSAPELFYGFPGATCISINEEVAHAIPGTRRICEGDLVNIDVSAELNGYVADTGASQPVGAVRPQLQALCTATEAALQAAIQVAQAGNQMADVQEAFDRVARKHGFTVIRNLAGHGVGRHIHEAPEHVPDYSRGKDRRRFQKGSVLTLEPFLSTGPHFAQETSDGWTLVTRPGAFTAQYEHTLIITEHEPIIVTRCDRPLN